MEKEMSDACVAQWWLEQSTGNRKTWARITAQSKASFFPQKDFKFFKKTIYWNFCELRILKFTIKGFWICGFIWKRLNRHIVELRLGLWNRRNLFQWRGIVVLRLSDAIYKIWIVKIRFVNWSSQLRNYG